MGVYYCRIKNIISGSSKDIVVGETAEDVLEKTVNHLDTLGEDGSAMRETIRRCIFEQGTKAIHNRSPR